MSLNYVLTIAIPALCRIAMKWESVHLYLGIRALSVELAQAIFAILLKIVMELIRVQRM